MKIGLIALKRVGKIRVNKLISIISSTYYCTILGVPIILLMIENGLSSLILIRGNYWF